MTRSQSSTEAKPRRETGAGARVPFHPILAATVIVLTLWLDTAISPYAMVRSLAFAVGGATILVGLLSALTRSLAVGGLGATAIIGLLWSKESFAVMAGVADRMGTAGFVWWILLAGAVTIVIRLVVRSRGGWTTHGVTRLANGAGTLLLAATLLLGILNGRLLGALDDLDQGRDLGAWQASLSGSTDDRPDIYVILLDGYPRADVLEYAFEIDNSAFTDALETRGFGIADAAHSDYLWTHVSVPAALNLAFVEQIPAMRDVIEGRRPRQPTLRRTIADNVAFDTARAHGYTPVAIGSGFEEVAPREADVYVDGGQLNEFELSLLWSTYLGDVVSAVAPDFASGQQRARILHNLDVLPQIAATHGREPAFVFAHVPAPHQPVVFRSDGSGVPVPITDAFYADSPAERGEDPEAFRARYGAQLPYLNDVILETIDGILRESERPPVIVLFADHGSASAVDWNAVDPGEAEPARLLERTGILFAALTLEHPGLYPDDISPTNMLRLLFDAYLGTDFGMANPPPDGGQVEPVGADALEGH